MPRYPLSEQKVVTLDNNRVFIKSLFFWEIATKFQQEKIINWFLLNCFNLWCFYQIYLLQPVQNWVKKWEKNFLKFYKIEKIIPGHL